MAVARRFGTQLREEVVCYLCGNPVEPFTQWRCPSCGGPTVLSYTREFNTSMIKKNVHSMWRYRQMFPPSMRRNPVTLGEGMTPVCPAVTSNISMKLEYVAPTGSFKDRGSAAMFTSLRNIVKDVKGVSEDSSGNAGASVAAYAAALGLECYVFGGDGMLAEKAMQIRAYGAELRIVRGGRDDVAAEAQQKALEKGFVYVGHAWNPYFIEGMKTVAYEIAEQTSWNPPERIYLPVSAGTLLLGVIQGFRDLLEAGLVENIPKIIAVQTIQRPALYEAFKNVTLPEEDKPSIADALTLTNPPRLRQMVEELRLAGGDVEVVSDEEIMKALKQMGLAGVYAEPSSAVAYAAVRRSLDEIVSMDEKVMVLVTGFGCKTTQHLQLVE
ncbi:MAG: pyridoxal-phosphate dependent enzyme [Candidatus Caldarchaeum sp.]|uniref:Pyridoxal-phosphate dependent enzyme n=1 Tax=Caldiarchaeum subterraneum TaxID=311458 RepID=A0A7C5Q8J3_CALS0